MIGEAGLGWPPRRWQTDGEITGLACSLLAQALTRPPPMPTPPPEHGLWGGLWVGLVRGQLQLPGVAGYPGSIQSAGRGSCSGEVRGSGTRGWAGGSRLRTSGSRLSLSPKDPQDCPQPPPARMWGLLTWGHLCLHGRLSRSSSPRGWLETLPVLWASRSVRPPAGPAFNLPVPVSQALFLSLSPAIVWPLESYLRRVSARASGHGPSLHLFTY